MAQIIEITCPACGYRWQVDLDNEQNARVFFKGTDAPKVERYRFRCPKEGTWTVITVDRKEEGHA